MTLNSVQICQRSRWKSSRIATPSEGRRKSHKCPGNRDFPNREAFMPCDRKTFPIGKHFTPPSQRGYFSCLPSKNTKAQHQLYRQQAEISLKAMPLHSPIEDTGCNRITKQMQKTKYWNIPLSQGTVPTRVTEAQKPLHRLWLLQPSSRWSFWPQAFWRASVIALLEVYHRKKLKGCGVQLQPWPPPSNSTPYWQLTDQSCVLDSTRYCFLAWLPHSDTSAILSGEGF